MAAGCHKVRLPMAVECHFIGWQDLDGSRLPSEEASRDTISAIILNFWFFVTSRGFGLIEQAARWTAN